jgi:hypothetical protein
MISAQPISDIDKKHTETAFQYATDIRGVSVNWAH